MYLRETGIGKKRALLARPPGRRHVAALGIGRKKKNISIAACCQDDSISGMRGNLAGHQIAHDNALGISIYHYQLEHFCSWKHLHRPKPDLPAERLVRSEQQLRPRLASRVKSSRPLRSAKRAMGEQAAVLARE